MLIGMVLELAGLGIVVPALALMSRDSPATPSPAVAAWLDWLGNPSRTTLLLGGLTALLGLYAFKAAFLLFSIWRQNRFVRSLQNDISERLFSVYLLQPWTFHLQRNSAELVRNVQDVVTLANLLASVLGTLAEAIVLTGVVLLLVWFEPMGAIAVAALLAIAAVIMERATKARLIRWGQTAHKHAALQGKHLVQGLHAAKDIKILGCERTFIEQFLHHSIQRASMVARQSLLNTVPRLWFELVAVASLCVLTAVMVWQGKSTQEMIPTLGLFAAAAFRLLPSVNKLLLGVQSLRFSEPVATTIASELAIPIPPDANEPAGDVTFRDRLAVEHVSFAYPKAAQPSLSDVSLTIRHGASVGLIGGSGAGKSTLVDIVLGLLTPTSGRVVADGIDIASNTRGWQRLVGYVPQAIYLSDDTIRRNVAFGVREAAIDDDAVARALKSAQLEQFVETLPDGIHTLVGDRGFRLSGGQRQRIGIARALYHDPELLVLDEATSALDNDTERDVMDAIESLHGTKTLLIVAHRLTTVERCDVVYHLEGGRVTRFGSYAEVVGA